jgi:hypothetical protein
VGKVWTFGDSLVAVMPGEVICILDGDEQDQHDCLTLAQDYGDRLEFMGVLPDGRELVVFTVKRNV